MAGFGVDREPIVCSTLRDFLEDTGHEVRTAQTPDELSAASMDEDFDAEVVLTETQTPAASSLARVKTISARFPRAAIIEMNNAPPLHDTDADRPLSPGVLGHLRKPIRLAELDMILKNLENFDSSASKGAVFYRQAALAETAKMDEQKKGKN